MLTVSGSRGRKWLIFVIVDFWYDGIEVAMPFTIFWSLDFECEYFGKQAVSDELSPN